MKQDFVIIGGGVAGLCAANRLVELGATPLIIEAGQYPAHKVCGEFFSPECLACLKQWNIQPVKISQANLRTSSQTFAFSFPSEAGSLSHLEFDPSLVEQACAKGAHIRTQTKVLALHPKQETKNCHEIELSSGEKIQAHNLLIATGRIPNYQAIPTMHYVGIKAHFENIPMGQTLEMFSFPGAYVGIAPIENQKFNIACLAQKKRVETAGSPHDFMLTLMSANPLFKFYLSNGKKIFADWMQTSVPAFGIKKTPHWLDTYFIGDAAGTIPPACGNGLSMAISSGCLAAEYAIRKDFQGFKKAWYHSYASQIFWGKFLHEMMMRPRLGNSLLCLAKQFPFLAHLIFNATRNNNKGFI